MFHGYFIYPKVVNEQLQQMPLCLATFIPTYFGPIKWLMVVQRSGFVQYRNGHVAKMYVADGHLPLIQLLVEASHDSNAVYKILILPEIFREQNFVG